MRPWRWLVGRFRSATPEAVMPAFTPAEEHASARRRVDELNRQADELEARARTVRREADLAARRRPHGTEPGR